MVPVQDGAVIARRGRARIARRSAASLVGAAVLAPFAAGRAAAASGDSVAAAEGGSGQVLSVAASPVSVRQGRSVLAEIEGDGGLAEGLAVRFGLAEQEPVWLPAFDVVRPDGGMRRLALAGVPVDAPMGPWWVAASRLPFSEAEAAGAVVEVVDGGFALQRLVFAQELMSLLEPEVGEEERFTMLTVMAAGVAGPQPRWRGAFRQPVVGRVVTSHGARRDYLSPAGRVVAQSQHGGVDLAAGLGIPIAAAAAGVVAFVGRWSIRGNVVVVDHGAGVHTVYAHASELLVAAGQEVVQGQALARVGSTGLSTGPHLHWEVRVHGVAVDPLEWTQREDLGLL